MNIETWFDQDLMKPVQVKNLGNIFNQDSLGNLIGVRVKKNGDDFTLSGSVNGYCILADGSTVPVIGTRSGSEASIILPASAYSVTGPIAIAIKLTEGNAITTLAACVGIVTRSRTGVQIDPGQTVTDWTNQIAAALQDMEDASAAQDAKIDDLKSATVFFGNGIPMTLHWNYGYIKATDLSIVNGGSTHVYSDVVLIPAGNMIYMPRVNKSTSVALLTLCNAEGTPQQLLLAGVSTTNSTYEHILYPFFEDTYVRIGGNMSESEHMKYYIKKIEDDIIFDESTFALFNPPKTFDYTNDSKMTIAGTRSAIGMCVSNRICLPKGMTLEYWGNACGEVSGSYNAVTVCKVPASGTTESYEAIVAGTSRIQHGEYTATEHMFVRLCARIAPNAVDFNVVLPEQHFKSWRIYYKGTHYGESIKNSPLYEKKMTVMGDSLMYGNRLGNGAVWATAVGIKYNMDVINLGVNGNPVARVPGITGMVDRLSSIPLDTDIFVLDGGANDRNNNVPIGEIDSTDPTEFCGALNIIISTFRQMCPKAKFLLLTNWKRYATNNYIDKNYVDAMIAVAENRCVPVFDNWRECGITFLEPSQKAWIDEAKNRQKLVDGSIVYYEDVEHFSIEAYEWLTPLYENLIAHL